MFKSSGGKSYGVADRGAILIALGRAPGPAFGPILDAAFEAQLDGAFGDETGGLAWLRAHAE